MLFLTLTSVIGTGVFTDYGSAIATAGPAGLLIAIAVVGLIAISFMECLSEMIQLFPTVNPLVEFVHEFVDHELAIVVGLVYWFAYAAFMACQLCTAASYMGFYAKNIPAEILGFYFLGPIIILFLNLKPVTWYAWVETIGGFLKICLMGVVFCILIDLAGEGSYQKKNFSSGNAVKMELTHPGQADGPSGSALCLVILYVAFSFIGIESVALTSFEAFEVADLRRASQSVGYITFIIYLATSIVMCLCKTDGSLLGFTLTGPPNPAPETTGATTSLAVQTAILTNNHSTAKAINAVMIYCAVSASNTTLYIASRMMFGMAHHLINATARWHRLRKSRIFPVLELMKACRNGVPKFSVYFSAGSFCLWLTFTQIKPSVDTHKLLSFFIIGGSISVIFVWGMQCLAYLRYDIWLKKFRGSEWLTDETPWLNKWSEDPSQKGFSNLSTFLGIPQLQVVFASFGLAGCLSIVFVFSTSSWWGRRPAATEVFRYFLVPMLLPLLWLALKLNRWYYYRREFTWMVDLDPDLTAFEKAITHLRVHLKPDQRHQGAIRANSEDTRVEAHQMHGMGPRQGPIDADMPTRTEGPDLPTMTRDQIVEQRR